MIAGLLQEVAGRLFQQEQRSELSLERGIARAQLPEKHLTVVRGQLQCRLQQAVELSESIRIHRLPGALSAKSGLTTELNERIRAGSAPKRDRRASTGGRTTGRRLK